MKSIVMGLALSFAGLTALAADRQQNDAGELYCTTVSACEQSTTMCVYSPTQLTTKQIQEAAAETIRELCKNATPKQLEEIEGAF